MPVTTRRQSRGHALPIAMDEDERNRSEKTLRGSYDDDDLIEGSLDALSSSEDDDNDASEGDVHVSGLSEGEESDTSEFGEGILHSRR